MLYMQISTHSPESCPMHNEKVKKATVDLMTKMDSLTKKHKIKVIGGWHSGTDHQTVIVFDAPSIDSVMGFSMEPEVMIWTSYHNTEVKPVMTLEESMKFLK
jgi:hypothetical protein